MKKKLYRIGNSKEPNIRQMMKMAENLRSVYNDYCSIEARAGAFTSSLKIEYVIYIAGKPGTHFPFKSWSRVIRAYRLLMEKKNV